MFVDRLQAARRLAERLGRYRGADPLVLPVPRGGVPMGAVLADALDGELDVVLVHKLGAPGTPEFAIGAVGETGDVLLQPRAQELARDPAWLAQEIAAQRRELARRRALFTAGRGAPDAAGRTVIVVDDGVATGSTLLAALRLIRRSLPRRLVAAVAVAPRGVAARLADEADEVVCLDEPLLFFSVGEHFEDFRQVEDAEMVATLQRAAARRHGAAATPRA